MNLTPDNKIINGLWIGRRLSAIELLTIRSFLGHGHAFHLWVYEDLETPLPSGALLRDANTILSKDKIFRYKHTDQYGHGKGSLAGFSDLFRYKLLYEQGGWWVDMDVTCLKPLDFPSPYVFRPHHDMPVVGNVMKCPVNSPLMEYCFERASREVDEDNRDWHLPIQILNDGIARFGLSGYILDIANPESWYENRKLILNRIELPEHWHVIHWINEEWRRNGVNKNYSHWNSTLRQLLIKNKVPVKRISLRQRTLSFYRISLPVRMAVDTPGSFLALTRTFIARKVAGKKRTLKESGVGTSSVKSRHCPYLLNHFMISFNGDVGYCRPHLPDRSIRMDEFSWESFFQMRDAHRMDLENGQLERCVGCTYLHEGKGVPGNYPFNFLDLNFSSFCNLRCVYCYISKEDLARRDMDSEKQRLELLKDILSKKMFDPKGGVSFSGGEPVITSVFEEACSLLREYSRDISYTFVTNCTRLSPEIVRLMKTGASVCLMISLDSADREMFRKIKGGDLFDRTLENLKQYISLSREHPNNHIQLKFILLEENVKAIKEFLDLAVSLGITRVFYDIDNRTTYDEEKLKTVIPAAVEFCIEARRRGLEPVAESTGLSRQELKERIMAGCRAALASHHEVDDSLFRTS